MSDLFLGVTWADIADWLPELLRGLKTSLLVAAISLAAGLPLGVALAVAAVVRGALELAGWVL